MIAIVNYGSGNIQAICNIYKRLAVPYFVAASPEQIGNASRIILPGVGSFDQAMGELEKSGLRSALDRCVHEEKRPILGICVGMQLLARRSDEGTKPGLGWIDGEVRRFHWQEPDPRLQLPHMGWNTVEPARADPLFSSLDTGCEFYFLHSYYFASDLAEDHLALTTYGCRFASAVARGNIYGVQFHPEKSHSAGIQLLKNFATLPA